MACKIGSQSVCRHEPRIFRIKERLTPVCLVLLIVSAGISAAPAQDRTVTLPARSLEEGTSINTTSGKGGKESQGTIPSESLTTNNPAVAKVRSFGTNDVEIFGIAPGSATITWKKKIDNEANYTTYRITVTVTPKPPKPIAPVPPNRPAGGGGAPRPAPPRRAVVIDKCLVGKWRSESIKALGDELEGGSGILLTFGADGQVTIDYSEMKPLIARNSGTNQIIVKNEWTGKASVHISIDKDKAVKIESVEESDISIKITTTDGTTGSKSSRLGPVGLGRPPNLGYTCDETTLTYEAGPYKITFKKVK